MINVFGISFLAGLFATIVAYLTRQINVSYTSAMIYFCVYGFILAWILGHMKLKEINRSILRLAD